jgi:hypothetical protein
VHLARDQGQAHARDRFHPERAQNRDMRVARADEHHILDDRLPYALHGSLWSTSRGSPGVSESGIGMVSIRSRRHKPRDKASTAMETKAGRDNHIIMSSGTRCRSIM